MHLGIVGLLFCLRSTPNLMMKQISCQQHERSPPLLLCSHIQERRRESHCKEQVQKITSVMGIVKDSDPLKLSLVCCLNSPSPHYPISSIAGDHTRKKLRCVLIRISFSCDPEKSTVFDVNLLK